jgi:hypothetical protein
MQMLASMPDKVHTLAARTQQFLGRVSQTRTKFDLDVFTRPSQSIWNDRKTQDRRVCCLRYNSVHCCIVRLCYLRFYETMFIEIDE